MYLKKLLFVVFLFSIIVALLAQNDEIHFVVDGRLTSDDGRSDGATITISKDGQQQEVVTPPRTGKFLFELDYNHEYRLTFNRDGFFQKIIIISTFVPNEVLQKNNKFPPLSFVLNLFEKTDLIDNSFTIKPVARVFYNSRIDNFDSEIYLSDEQLRKQIQAAEAAQNALASERRSMGRADEMEQAALEKQYDKTIADADALYHKKNYEGAISQFREALMLFSDRPYPKDRIAEIEDLMATLQLAEEAEQNYLAAIKAGDEQFNATQYAGAIGSYEKALEYKAKDKYATDRIAESRKLQKEQIGNMQYNDLIARADEAYNTQVYTDAKNLYQQAIEVRPRDSEYPRDQIRKIDLELAHLAEQQRVEGQYAAAMNRGNASFNQAAYPSALTAFKEALGLKPGDQPAQERIAATEAAMQQLANNEKYEELIAKADEWFDKNVLDSSKNFYQQALTVKPAEQYPKDRIAEIDRRMQLNQQLNQLLAEANASFDHQEYPLAKTKYQQVLALKADHELSKNRIAEIDRILAQQAIEDQYASAIAAADQAFNTQQYAVAKGSYQQALGIKPDEKYPKDQIAKIDLELQRLAAQATLDEQYAQAIEQADAAFNTKFYENAITAYEAALKLKPKETYPPAQISKAKQLIAERLKNEQLERSYLAYISKGDSLFKLNSYQPAKLSYTDASRLKPNEQYPKDKIAEIDGLLADLQHQQEVLAELNRTYAAAIKRGDDAFKIKDFETAIDAYNEAHLLKKEEEYPVNQLAEIERLKATATEQAYQAAIQKADALFNQNELASAKPEYQNALPFKTDDAYATGQIAIIDQRLRDAALAEAERQKLEEAYAAKIAAADQAFNTENYTGAKPLYQQALTLKAAEKYPADQIAKIDGILAELARLAGIDAQYKQAMSSAKTSFDQDLLAEALTYYKQAAGLKPQEPEPPQRIAEIEQLQAQRAEEARLAAEAEAQRIAAEKAARDKYNAAIALGDASMNQKAYNKAQEAYNNALTIRPDEQYPKDKLAEIANILQQLAQAEELRGQQAREDSLAAAKLTAFNLKIKEAEAFIDDQKLENAVTSYREAIVILPEKEPIVQPKIKELEDLIAQLAKLEADYLSAIQKADGQFANEAWNEAKSTYLQAVNLKPEESYPKQQIEKIDLKLKELELMAERARAAEKANAAYNEAIKIADENFDKQDYTVAQFYYQKAAGLQPENPYPKQRLDEISKLIDQSLAADQIKAYNDAISKADQEFDRKGYTLAKFYYNKALEIKSWEQYPKDRITEIGKLTNTLLSQREEQDYLNWISTADEAFVNKDFAVARSYYQRALALKKDEPYPSIRLSEIQKELEKQQAEQTEKEYQAAITEADKAFESKNFSVARFYYNKAAGIRPNEKYPKDQLQLIREALGGN